MYDLPGMENVAKVVVDESTIIGDAVPYIIYQQAEPRRAASSD